MAALAVKPAARRRADGPPRPTGGRRRAAGRWLAGLAPVGLVLIGLVLAGPLLAPPLAGTAVAQGLVILQKGGAAETGAPPAGGPAAGPLPADGPLAEAVPEPVLVLVQDGPLAADGEGRVLMLRPLDNGYGLYGQVAGPVPHAPDPADPFERIYRRKGVYATSLAVSGDGTICVGSLRDVECISPSGRVTLHQHPLLNNIIALAFAPDGHLWILRSTEGDAAGLQLVRATPGLGRIDAVLTLRRNIQGFRGNGLAAGPDGSAFVPVVENDIHRVLKVQPDGRFSRVGDFWRLGGGIAVDQAETVLAAGVKRPQSVQEQREPQDVLFGQAEGAAAAFAARFPVERGGSRMSSHQALGGDGDLYVVRWQRIPVEGAPAPERPVLWRVPVGRISAAMPGRVIDFRIPFIDWVARPGLVPEYEGPPLVAPGGPLAIVGENFVGKDGLARVLVGGRPAPILHWEDTVIVVLVPEDAPGGTVDVQVAIDEALSNAESMEVKTPEVPGWFQVGTSAVQEELVVPYLFEGYYGEIVVRGQTDQGEPVELREVLRQPGMFYTRLPNGEYEATFNAAYRSMAAGRPVAVQVPSQTAQFRITDAEPIAVWLPAMY